ncbi:MAG: LysM peptidoglycan-binding domain-containing protein [Defluviitaleaceae bacterium]|nr:LysM peptidoglycan-binding domain-containing protein [Defluviitaleaceae bacterium]
MSNFELPTNIRQIGNLEGQHIKIYVEDYVCTYLKQYAESGGHTEKVAFLAGKYMIIDGQPYAFISGVIQGKYSEYSDNMECFTDASYEHARQELEKYFPSSEILGWMQSQPGYGVHVNPSYADYHMNNFTRPYQLLFVMDPVEKLNLFYVWNEEMTGISEAGGYFIYYDQNRAMQDYMNDNRIKRAATREIQPKEETATGRIKIFDDTEKRRTGRPERRLHREEPETENIKPANPTGRTATGSVRTTERAETRLAAKAPNKPIEDMRKMSNLLIGLCAVLFITTFIMGAGLLQSDSRISAVENAILTMDGNYVLLADQMRQMASLPVFAEQRIAPPVPTPAPEPEAAAEPTMTPPPVPTPEPPPTPTPIPEPDPTPEPFPTPLPETEPEPTPAVTTFANLPETYTIQPGDSLLAISRMFYGDATMVYRIMEINDIEDPDHIIIGQIIYLPSY